MRPGCLIALPEGAKLIGCPAGCVVGVRAVAGRTEPHEVIEDFGLGMCMEVAHAVDEQG